LRNELWLHGMCGECEGRNTIHKRKREGQHYTVPGSCNFMPRRSARLCYPLLILRHFPPSHPTHIINNNTTLSRLHYVNTMSFHAFNPFMPVRALPQTFEKQYRVHSMAFCHRASLNASGKSMCRSWLGYVRTYQT
jgi:hypothetical protein